MTHFDAAIEAHFEHSKDHPQCDVWKQYARGTNERGKALSEKMRTWLPQLAGRRALDVGSGYGGTTLAFACAGASAVGLEVDRALIAVAEANKRDQGSVDATFMNVDAMDWQQLAPLGLFDVVTCDNVIEHVPWPHVLVAHLRRLLKPDGVLYLTAPNAFSFGQIRSECHYGQPGLSLLSPIDGRSYLKAALGSDSYDVSDYFTADGYLALFARFGLFAKLLNPVQAGEAEVQVLRDERASFLARFPIDKVPEALRPRVESALARHLACIDADLRWFDALPAASPEREAFAHLLFRDYCVELWYFALSPTQTRVEPELSRPPPAEPVQPIRADALRLAERIASRAARLIPGRR
jgi:2-polyprenyl-3-methyl-5-hydroxy-6-metoxy-1,4-benzoquinol methylase